MTTRQAVYPERQQRLHFPVPDAVSEDSWELMETWIQHVVRHERRQLYFGTCQYRCKHRPLLALVCTREPCVATRISLFPSAEEISSTEDAGEHGAQERSALGLSCSWREIGSECSCHL